MTVEMELWLQISFAFSEDPSLLSGVEVRWQTNANNFRELRCGRAVSLAFVQVKLCENNGIGDYVLSNKSYKNIAQRLLHYYIHIHTCINIPWHDYMYFWYLHIIYFEMQMLNRAFCICVIDTELESRKILTQKMKDIDL